jgi:hypothetical protein
MHCSKCSSSNPDTSNFCGKCGAALQQTETGTSAEERSSGALDITLSPSSPASVTSTAPPPPPTEPAAPARAQTPPPPKPSAGASTPSSPVAPTPRAGKSKKPGCFGQGVVIALSLGAGYLGVFAIAAAVGIPGEARILILFLGAGASYAIATLIYRLLGWRDQ